MRAGGKRLISPVSLCATNTVTFGGRSWRIFNLKIKFKKSHVPSSGSRSQARMFNYVLILSAVEADNFWGVMNVSELSWLQAKKR